MTAWRPERSALRYVVTVYLAVRAGLTVLGLVSVALLPRSAPVNVPGWPAPPLTPGWHNAITAWERWDALWYLRIAAHGYRTDDASPGFFPLYPLVVRGVGVVLGSHWLLAAYLVSNLALVVALYLLYQLTATERDVSTARLVVLLVCLFPTGFYLFAPYTESLFLLLSVGCLYAARRDQWAVALACGIGASATRSTGILLALPLAVAALQGARAQPRLQVLRRLAVAGLTPLGMLAYMLWWRHQAGDLMRPVKVQRSFGPRHWEWPWVTVWHGLRVATQFIGAYAGGYHTSDALIVLVCLAAGVWAALRTRPMYAVYAWASLVFPLLLPFPGRPFISMPRYELVVFPLFWGFAAFAQRFRAEQAVVATSAAFLGVFGLLFVNWYFIF